MSKYYIPTGKIIKIPAGEKWYIPSGLVATEPSAAAPSGEPLSAFVPVKQISIKSKHL